MKIESGGQPAGAIIPIELHESDKGSLITIQAFKDVPFEICRIYTIFAVPAGAVRGNHAHRNERQLLVCLHGSCKITLDSGVLEQQYQLNSPAEGLFIDSYVWRVLSDFSEDCVLSVLSDSPYDADDYIFDYEEFKQGLCTSSDCTNNDRISNSCTISDQISSDRAGDKLTHDEESR